MPSLNQYYNDLFKHTQKHENTYNGWRNFATWRHSLILDIDGTDKYIHDAIHDMATNNQPDGYIYDTETNHYMYPLPDVLSDIYPIDMLTDIIYDIAKQILQFKIRSEAQHCLDIFEEIKDKILDNVLPQWILSELEYPYTMLETLQDALDYRQLAESTYNQLDLVNTIKAYRSAQNVESIAE